MIEHYELIINTLLWAVAVFLYYHAGKKHGYAAGYIDGIDKGHTNVLQAFRAKAEYLEDTCKQ